MEYLVIGALTRSGSTCSSLINRPNRYAYIYLYSIRILDVISIFTNPSARPEGLVNIDTRSIFKQILTGLNSEFSFSKISCLTKVKEPSLPYYLPIAEGWLIEFIHFPKVLMLCEMLSVSSRIWTGVAVPISYDDNHYITWCRICT